MDLIAQCVREAVPEGERAARAFRVKYPDEINLDTLNGKRWRVESSRIDLMRSNLGGLWHSAEVRSLVAAEEKSRMKGCLLLDSRQRADYRKSRSRILDAALVSEAHVGRDRRRTLRPASTKHR